MSNVRRIPYTELVERLQGELLRDTAANVNSEKKYKGVINDVYTVDFPILLPEDFLRKTGNFATKEDYSTGTITTTVAGTTITGASTSWTEANSDGSLLKADDTETVFRVGYSAGTTLSLTAPSTWVDDAVTAGDYRLMFDRYTLASDFDSIVQDDIEDPEVVHYWTGGGRQRLEPQDNGEYERDFSFNRGIPAKYTIKHTDGTYYMHLWPCDDDTRQIFYDYIPTVLPMVEVTAGTATVALDATAVTGTSTFWGNFIDTTVNDYYFRFDIDGEGQASEWYKITSVTTDEALVLSTAYTGDAARTAKEYTISMIPKWPAKYDTAILYTAVYKLEPRKVDADRWAQIASTIIPGWKSYFGRRIHGRTGAQDLGGYLKNVS